MMISATIKSYKKGFTLAEMLVVLMIIAVISSVIVPLAGRSNRGLAFDKCYDELIGTLRLAAEWSGKKNCTVKFVVNCEQKYYQMQIEQKEDSGFAVDGVVGRKRYFADSISLVELEEFAGNGGERWIEFSPDDELPRAKVILYGEESVVEILIRNKKAGRSNEFEDRDI